MEARSGMIATLFLLNIQICKHIMLWVGVGISITPDFCVGVCVMTTKGYLADPAG